MISDEELKALLEDAAGSLPVPARGPEAIMAAATATSASNPKSRWSSFKPRELVFAGTSLAAVVTLVIVLLVSGGTSVVNGQNLGVRSVPPATAKGVGIASPAAINPARTSGGQTKAKGAPTASRDIIATGTLRLGVTPAQLKRSVAALEGLAGSFGGYVGHASIAETGKHLGGSIVIEVPAKSFSSLVTKARHAGSVRSLSTADQDVTSQIVDLGARLTALKDERAQLEVLLGKAAKVSDLLAVEGQIEFVQSEIEQLQGEQRVLAQQVSFSALTVDLVVTRPHHPLASTTGFDHAWHVALTGFVNGVKAFVAHLGDIAFGALAVIVSLLVLLVLWRRVWPLVRRRLV